MVYQALYAAVKKSENKAGLAVIDKVEMFDGIAAWDALTVFHENPSTQNKLMAVTDFLGISQEPKETPLDYKMRLQKLFDLLPC